VTNIFQEGTWIFAATGPAIVVIGLTTDKKRALITENYGGQKFLIFLIFYETFANRTLYELPYLHP
jgi:hypothetical protein